MLPACRQRRPRRHESICCDRSRLSSAIHGQRIRAAAASVATKISWIPIGESTRREICRAGVERIGVWEVTGAQALMAQHDQMGREAPERAAPSKNLGDQYAVHGPTQTRYVPARSDCAYQRHTATCKQGATATRTRSEETQHPAPAWKRVLCEPAGQSRFERIFFPR